MRTAPANGQSAMRIDLHLHSHASGTATNWWVKSLGFGIETRESYTPPDEAYRLAKTAGMDFVTLTDHETVAGALTLAGRPDFLTGVEVCARFPEDGSTVDVLVYGLDEAAHWEIQARRGSVYRLVDFLREAGLVHVLAHPMVSFEEPLDRAAVEKRLALFGLWEFVNGARPAAQNRLTRDVARSVDALDLRAIARRHGLPAPPYRAIAGTGGSDDHGGTHVGAAWTWTPAVHNVPDLLAAMAAGEVEPGGEDGTPEKLAHTGFRIAGAAFAEAQDRASGGDSADPVGVPFAAAAGDDEKLLEHLPLLALLDGAQIRALLAGQYERRIAGALAGAGSGRAVLAILGSLGRFVDGHAFIAPYVGVYGYFGREIEKARALRRRLFGAYPEQLKVGVFVDEMDQIHGVATMYQNIERVARARGDDRLRIVQCGAGDAAAIVHLRPIAALPMPLVEGRSLGVPSLLDVLEHVATEGYDVLHIATPGPLGLAALVAGITLGVPTVGAYHTEFGSYAGILSGDSLVANLVEIAVREFYQRCAVVAVSSAATAHALRHRGYQIDRFEILKNGVDTRLFDPGRRDEALRRELGGGRVVLLYAGRVSREKGLERLADGYLAMRTRRDDVHLVIAGDGPYWRDLEEKLGPAATFTGFVRGEELARVYASADLFVFPSETDTLGRAVAEAQASGIPAVVYRGGPAECIRPAASGFVVEPGDGAAFFRRVETLVDDPGLRGRMGRAARAFAEGLSWDNVLDGLLDLYAAVIGVPIDPSEPLAAGPAGSEPEPLAGVAVAAGPAVAAREPVATGNGRPR